MQLINAQQNLLVLDRVSTVNSSRRSFARGAYTESDKAPYAKLGSGHARLVSMHVCMGSIPGVMFFYDGKIKKINISVTDAGKISTVLTKTKMIC